MILFVEVPKKADIPLTSQYKLLMSLSFRVGSWLRASAVDHLRGHSPCQILADSMITPPPPPTLQMLSKICRNSSDPVPAQRDISFALCSTEKHRVALGIHTSIKRNDPYRHSGPRARTNTPAKKSPILVLKVHEEGFVLSTGCLINYGIHYHKEVTKAQLLHTAEAEASA